MKKSYHLVYVLSVTVLGSGAASGCAEDDVDAAGNYTVAVTNGENGCEFENWTVGEQATGIALTITQDGSSVSGTVGGFAGQIFNLVLGDDTLTGSVSGNDITLRREGTQAVTMGNCTYTYNATVKASLDGDFLEGTIDYAAATNGGSECGTKTGCHSIQAFNGSRPPSVEE